MKKFLSCLIISCFLSTFNLNAKEVYCSIEQLQDDIRIIPNNEYLTDSYWHYILYDIKGEKRKFNNIDEATSILSSFGWRIVKIKILNNRADSYIYIMAHELESYYEIKSSRDRNNELFN